MPVPGQSQFCGSLVKHSGDILVGCLSFRVFQDVQPRSEYPGRYVGFVLRSLLLRRGDLRRQRDKQARCFDVFAGKVENDRVVLFRVTIANDSRSQNRQCSVHLKRPWRLLEFFICEGKVDPFLRDQERMAENSSFYPCADAVPWKPKVLGCLAKRISLNPKLMEMLFFLKLVLSCQELRNPRGRNHFSGP